MEFEIGFSFALLVFLTIGIPFYILSNVQSKNLKFISLCYYVVCMFITIFVSFYFYTDAPKIFKISPTFSICISIITLPIVFYLSCLMRKKEKLAFSELRKIGILLPYIYAIAPVTCAFCSYIFIYFFNNSQIAFGITLGGVGLAIFMWQPASFFLIIFTLFTYVKRKKSIDPVLETLSISEPPRQCRCVL